MINTTLCYIQKNDSYLMLHRTKKENDINKDKWIGIGGKFENEESPEDCVRREVLEETGLTLKNFRYCGIVTFVDKSKDPAFTEFMHLYWSDDFEGKLHTCNEGDLEWVPITKMNDLPHWKGDEIFLDLIAKKSPFFSLKLVYKNGELVETSLYTCP